MLTITSADKNFVITLLKKVSVKNEESKNIFESLTPKLPAMQELYQTAFEEKRGQANSKIKPVINNAEFFLSLNIKKSSAKNKLPSAVYYKNNRGEGTVNLNNTSPEIEYVVIEGRRDEVKKEFSVVKGSYHIIYYEETSSLLIYKDYGHAPGGHGMFFPNAQDLTRAETVCINENGKVAPTFRDVNSSLKPYWEVSGLDKMKNYIVSFCKAIANRIKTLFINIVFLIKRKKGKKIAWDNIISPPSVLDNSSGAPASLSNVLEGIPALEETSFIKIYDTPPGRPPFKPRMERNAKADEFIHDLMKPVKFLRRKHQKSSVDSSKLISSSVPSSEKAAANFNDILPAVEVPAIEVPPQKLKFDFTVSPELQFHSDKYNKEASVPTIDTGNRLIKEPISGNEISSHNNAGGLKPHSSSVEKGRAMIRNSEAYLSAQKTTHLNLIRSLPDIFQGHGELENAIKDINNQFEEDNQQNLATLPVVEASAPLPPPVHPIHSFSLITPSSEIIQDFTEKRRSEMRAEIKRDHEARDERMKRDKEEQNKRLLELSQLRQEVEKSIQNEKALKTEPADIEIYEGPVQNFSKIGTASKGNPNVSSHLLRQIEDSTDHVLILKTPQDIEAADKFIRVFPQGTFSQPVKINGQEIYYMEKLGHASYRIGVTPVIPNIASLQNRAVTMKRGNFDGAAPVVAANQEPLFISKRQARKIEKLEKITFKADNDRMKRTRKSNLKEIKKEAKEKGRQDKVEAKTALRLKKEGVIVYNDKRAVKVPAGMSNSEIENFIAAKIGMVAFSGVMLNKPDNQEKLALEQGLIQLINFTEGENPSSEFEYIIVEKPKSVSAPAFDALERERLGISNLEHTGLKLVTPKIDLALHELRMGIKTPDNFITKKAKKFLTREMVPKTYERIDIIEVPKNLPLEEEKKYLKSVIGEKKFPKRVLRFASGLNTEEKDMLIKGEMASSIRWLHPAEKLSRNNKSANKGALNPEYINNLEKAPKDIVLSCKPKKPSLAVNFGKRLLKNLGSLSHVTPQLNTDNLNDINGKGRLYSNSSELNTRNIKTRVKNLPFLHKNTRSL